MSDLTKIEFLKNPKVRTFLTENEDMDPLDLHFKIPEAFKGQEKLLAEQLSARKKARKKLPSWLQTPGIIFPSALSVEQSSSESTANYKAELMGSGQHLIDLTGGLGVDCLAFSKCFASTTYVEKSSWLCEVMQSNSETLNHNIEVVSNEADSFLEELSEENVNFYIDPARRSDSGGRVYNLRDCSPNILEMLEVLCEKGIKTMIKTSPMLDITQTLKDLNGLTSEVHIVGVKGEVKELLFIVDSSSPSPDPLITCCNLGELSETYSFRIPEQQSAGSTFSDKTRAYLYDPNDMIIKGGAFDKIGNDFNLFKISANTHLYFSDELRTEFPGRIFKITHIKPGKDQLKTLKRINFISKNSPVKKQDILKKYSLKEGGESFLISYRNTKNQILNVLAERVK